MKKVDIGKKPTAVGTEVVIDQFKGHPMFQIWEVNAEGENTEPRPEFNFGVKKAAMLLKHMKELESFVKR